MAWKRDGCTISTAEEMIQQIAGIVPDASFEVDHLRGNSSGFRIRCETSMHKGKILKKAYNIRQ